MRHGRQSIGFRLTLLFAAISITVLLVLGFLVGKLVEQHFVEQDMERMTGKLHLAANLIGQVRTADDLEGLQMQFANSLVGHLDLSMMVRNTAGQVIFATAGASFPDSLLKRAAVDAPLQPQAWQRAGAEGMQHQRGIAARVPTAIPGLPPLMVAVSVDITHHVRFLNSFRRALWLFVALAAAFAGVLGWVVVRYGLAPLQTIRRGAASVTASRLDYRLAVDTIPVELAELAETLNEMLARLEDSFRRLRDFSTDLAHELRTPISNLMTETQVALTRARSEAEYREVLASNAEEYERLARMISDMLFLAQSDNGLIVPNREPVDLAAEIAELLDFFDALAEEKELKLSVSGAGQVVGDRLMLRRALANLLSNAIRHTPTGGRIQLRIESPGDGAIVSVENSGMPIPPEHLSRIFDRFYRADPSRHGGGEGAGLGLAITRAIIRAHGGDISARSTEDGVCFELHLA